MIDGLKPYKEYKESGLPWLGVIPAHWEVQRTRYLFREIDARSTTGKETQLSMSQVHGLVESSKIDSWRMRSESYVGGKLCDANDLVLNRLKAHLGVFAHAKIGGVISPDYSVFRPFVTVNTEYFERVLKIPQCVGEIRRFTKGIVEGFWRLYTDDFYNLSLPFPPPDEQAAIVRFLDHADRKIRRYIRAKRKLIALLNEQKQAIIHQAVTRGLDPNVKLKPSGVDWLGDVPEHWEVTRVKFAARKISKGDTPSNFGHDFMDGGPVRFIKIENIAFGELRDSPLYTIDFSAHEKLKRSQLQENDIVFAIAGATTGKCAIVRKTHLPANTNQAVAFIRPNTRVNPEFLVSWLQQSKLKEAMWLQTVQSAQPNLSMEELGNLNLILPSLCEQREILVSLRSSTAKIDNLIFHAESEMQFFREYRTRLIADVVTGKLDVREAAAQLDGQVTEKPSKRRTATQPNKHFYRSVLAAEIVDRHQGERRFGRIKLQKALVLAEYHLQLNEIQSDLKRAAAGPFDNKMMRSIESQLKNQKWFEVYKSEDAGYQYQPLEKQGGHQSYFKRYWGSKQAEFDRLIDLIKPMRTTQAEIIATLYSAWNDFLLDGEQFDDDRLVAEVLTNWHPKKERISADRWRKAIKWMRDNQLVPTGFGAHTKLQTEKANKG